MYKCDRCGKEFSNSQGLGGHQVLCGSKSLVPRAEGSGLRAGEGSKQLQLRAGEGSGLRAQGSQAVKQAEDVSKKYQLTGKPYGGIQISWGRMLAALAIGGFVTWLVYQSLENWDWKGGSGKKQISPYKLIGGLIQGLG